MGSLYISDGTDERYKSESLPDRGKDVLNADALNALQGPLMAKFAGGWEWPVHDIEVETALMRIDVSGLLEAKSFCEVMTLTDIEGVEFNAEDFWVD